MLDQIRMLDRRMVGSPGHQQGASVEPSLPNPTALEAGHATVSGSLGSPQDAVPTPTPERAGWGLVALYSLSFAGGSLVLIAPLLVTLALKVDGLVGIEEAPKNLALVTGVGSLLAMVTNPLFGRLSDRTTSPLGMRRPWMLVELTGGTIGTLIVAVAPNVGVVLVGWCIAQLFFNALLAAQVAVLPDQVPASQRGMVSGVLGVCVPLASVSGTFLIQLFAPTLLAMFLAPCAVGGAFVLLFVLTLKDRHLVAADRPAW